MYGLLDEASNEVVRKADDFALEDGHQMIGWQWHQIRLEPAQALLGAAQYLLSSERGDSGAPVSHRSPDLRAGAYGHSGEIGASALEIGPTTGGAGAQVLLHHPYAAAGEVPGHAADQLLLEDGRTVPCCSPPRGRQGRR